MSPAERRVLVTTCFGHFMSHFNMLVFPAIVLPLSMRFGMKMGLVLELSFWMYLLFGLSALPWGLAADRWGAKPLLKVYYLGCGLCGLGAAASMNSPTALMFSLAGLGLFSGIYHPAGLGMISNTIKRLSVAMGYNGMFGNLGLAAAPILTGVVTWLWGPASAYIFVGLLNLAGLGLMAFLPLAPSTSVDAKKSGDGNGMLGTFMILLVVMMLGGIAYRGATVILPAYFELQAEGVYQWLADMVGQGMSKNLVATAITSSIFLVGMLGQFFGGQAAERYTPKYCYLVFHLLAVPAAFLMASVVDVSLVLVATVYFFFLLGMQPIENTLVANFTPERFRHSAFGFKFILTFGVGALAVHMVAAVEAGFGIRTVFPVLGFFSIALVIGILVLILNTRSRDPRPSKAVTRTPSINGLTK